MPDHDENDVPTEEILAMWEEGEPVTLATYHVRLIVPPGAVRRSSVVARGLQVRFEIPRLAWRTSSLHIEQPDTEGLASAI